MFNSAIGHYSQLVWAETYKVLQGSQVPQLPWMSLPEESGLGNLTRYKLQVDRQGHFGADPLDDLGGNGSLDQILTKASIMVLMKMIIM